MTNGEPQYHDDPSADIDFESEPDSMFLQNSSRLSLKHSETLKGISNELCGDKWVPTRNLSCLALENNNFIHGVSSSGYGVIGLSEQVLEKWPDPICKSLVYHERTHMQLNSEMRQTIALKHPEIDDAFHQVFLPLWEKGKVDLDFDHDYCSNKQWRGLFEGDGLYSNSTEAYQEAIKAYFLAFSKDKISMRNGKIDYIPNRMFTTWQSEMDEAPEVSFRDQFIANPRDTIKKIITGYELADILSTRYRDELAISEKVGLYDMEEGFANFVGTQMAGVEMGEMDKMFKQDDAKVRLANQVIERAGSLGITALEAIKQVTSLPELIEFYKELGIRA